MSCRIGINSYKYDINYFSNCIKVNTAKEKTPIPLPTRRNNLMDMPMLLIVGFILGVIIAYLLGVKNRTVLFLAGIAGAILAPILIAVITALILLVIIGLIVLIILVLIGLHR